MSLLSNVDILHTYLIKSVYLICQEFSKHTKVGMLCVSKVLEGGAFKSKFFSTLLRSAT